MIHILQMVHLTPSTEKCMFFANYNETANYIWIQVIWDVMLLLIEWVVLDVYSKLWEPFIQWHSITSHKSQILTFPILMNFLTCDIINQHCYIVRLNCFTNCGYTHQTTVTATCRSIVWDHNLLTHFSHTKSYTKCSQRRYRLCNQADNVNV